MQESPLIMKSKEFALKIIRVCNKIKNTKKADVITCSKIKVGRRVRPTFILTLENAEESNSEGNFAYKKRLIIVFSKISRAIYNCEGGGFP